MRGRVRPVLVLCALILGSSILLGPWASASSTVNRAYYSCYQAAVAALLQANIRPRGSRWGHAV